MPYLQADLFIGEITRRILRPLVAVKSLGPSPEVAAADVQVFAFGATAAHMDLFVLELVQQFNVRVVPDLGEGALQHIAEDVLAPELVGVHLAVPRDTADAPA